MLYRKMSSTGDKVSVLGFGCMRFPTDDDGNIKKNESEKMLDYAVDNGVNYFDTAWPYHGEKSEPFIGSYFQDNRKDIYLATKLPSWKIEKPEDLDEYFKKQLKRLKTDYIDYYLLHALNKKRWEKLLENDIFDFIEDIKKKNKIRAIGFSFHGKLETFKDIIDSYDWDFCQIQYNFMDTDYQAGREGLRYAADKGIDLVIMEPLRGGMLTNNVPEDIQEIWNNLGENSSPAEWALRWVWNHSEVTVTLSGMSNMNHVKENVDVSDKAAANSLTDKQLSIIDKVRKTYDERTRVNCTNCKYCMPCPNGVNIPGAFRFYNNAYIYNEFERMKNFYNRALDDDSKASKCIECGECLDKCPQNISIIEKLKEVAEAFE